LHRACNGLAVSRFVDNLSRIVFADTIAEADWFGCSCLPPIPSRISIARRLIDAFFTA